LKLGEWNHASKLANPNLLILDILHVSVHSKYDGITAYYDIAVLETETIAFSKAIKPVCLPA
jgi:hypothetical protein